MKPNEIDELTTWTWVTSLQFLSRMEAHLKPSGLTILQFTLLHHLVRPALESGARISEIAQVLQVNQPAVTKIITKFEGMGLVEILRHPETRRVRSVHATAKASELLTAVKEKMGPDLAQLFGQLPPEARPVFKDGLEALGTWMSAHQIK